MDSVFTPLRRTQHSAPWLSLLEHSWKGITQHGEKRIRPVPEWRQKGNCSRGYGADKLNRCTRPNRLYSETNKSPFSLKATPWGETTTPGRHCSGLSWLPPTPG